MLADTWLVIGEQQRGCQGAANGWEVGAYATLTDVPFNQFGEGSFDKGIYVTLPMDWLTGSPSMSQRTFMIRPITRDGGARLASHGSFMVSYEMPKKNKCSAKKEGLGNNHAHSLVLPVYCLDWVHKFIGIFKWRT